MNDIDDIRPLLPDPPIEKGSVNRCSITKTSLYAVLTFVSLAGFFGIPNFKNHMRVNVCVPSPIYGSLANSSRVRDFVQYYRALGFEKVIAYIHPEFKDDIQSFTCNAFDLVLWETSFDYTVSKEFHKIHAETMKRCIETSKQEGFDLTAVIDFDELLYYNPSKFQSMFDWLKLFHNSSQIMVKRRYHEIDICYGTNHSATIFDLPYTNSRLAKKHKSFVVPKDFVELRPEFLQRNIAYSHHFVVSGETQDFRDGFEDAHFMHYRRFLNWDRTCKRVESENIVFHKELVDQTDPDHKGNFAEPIERKFLLNKKLTEWKEHLETRSKSNLLST